MLLEPLRRLRVRVLRRRLKLIRLAAVGENTIGSTPGLAVAACENAAKLALRGFGVIWIASSAPSCIMSSSEDVSEPESVMLTLPIELAIADFSGFVMLDHSEVPCASESSPSPLRGILMAFPPIIGEESGLDWSASVEW